ncbi:MAG: FkbM family methyltransferase [Actinomycetota bacterium]|nr:FkbM family methyltransferase [Actinomycetota bacterium]
MQMRSAFALARQSIALDGHLIARTDMSIRDRIRFVGTKYRVLAHHAVKPFKLGEDAVVIGGQRIHYDTRFGIASYQGIMTRTQHLLDVAGIHSVDVVVDVGANVGFFSMMASRRFADPRILAIEPVPVTFRCLQQNLKLSPAAVAVNCAVSDVAGQLGMVVDDQNSAISEVSDEGNTVVDAKTLDQIVEEHNIDHIDLLKVDTESFEAHVLRGARQTLARTDHLLMEVTVVGNEHYTVPSLLALLESDTYSFQLVAMRNFSNKGEGAVRIMDCLFTNVKGLAAGAGADQR